MKKFIKNNYHKHLIIGALIGIVTSFVIHILGYDNASINLTVSAFIGLIAGVLWEGEQTYYYQSKWDWLDVIYSCVGSLVGSLIITLIF